MEIPTAKSLIMKAKLNVNTKLKEKYFIDNKTFYLKTIDEILYNEKTHLVAKFKDFLIYDDDNEFLDKFYEKKESLIMIPFILEHYINYSKINPVYILNKEGKIILKNLKIKLKQLLLKHINKENKDKLSIEKSQICYSLIERNFSDNDLLKNCINKAEFEGKHDSLIKDCYNENQVKSKKLIKNENRIFDSRVILSILDNLNLRESFILSSSEKKLSSRDYEFLDYKNQREIEDPKIKKNNILYSFDEKENSLNFFIKYLDTEYFCEGINKQNSNFDNSKKMMYVDFTLYDSNQKRNKIFKNNNFQNKFFHNEILNKNCSIEKETKINYYKNNNFKLNFDNLKIVSDSLYYNDDSNNKKKNIYFDSEDRTKLKLKNENMKKTTKSNEIKYKFKSESRNQFSKQRTMNKDTTIILNFKKLINENKKSNLNFQKQNLTRNFINNTKIIPFSPNNKISCKILNEEVNKNPIINITPRELPKSYNLKKNKQIFNVENKKLQFNSNQNRINQIKSNFKKFSPLKFNNLNLRKKLNINNPLINKEKNINFDRASNIKKKENNNYNKNNSLSKISDFSKKMEFIMNAVNRLSRNLNKENNLDNLSSKNTIKINLNSNSKHSTLNNNNNVNLFSTTSNTINSEKTQFNNFSGSLEKKLLLNDKNKIIFSSNNIDDGSQTDRINVHRNFYEKFKFDKKNINKIDQSDSEIKFINNLNSERGNKLKDKKNSNVK